MRFLRNLPIKQKLMGFTMTISGVALLLGCGVFAAYEQAAFRRTLARHFAISANIFDENVASGLAFNDTASIKQTLSTLNEDPRILAAAVFDKAGALVASFQRAEQNGRFVFPAAQSTGQRWGAERLDTFKDIELAGEVIGVVYIGVDLRELRERIWRYAAIVGVLLIGCLLVALVLASRLQRIISQPIEDLAQTVATVATEKNYTVRAHKEGDDELGRLIDGFNEMLAEIQTRDNALGFAHANLEKRVEARTAELAQENAVRKRVEAELRRIELRLGHAMSLAQLFAWEYDVASGLFTFSDRYYVLHGTTAEREGGNRMSALEFVRKFVHPDDAHLIAEEVGKAVVTTEPNYRAQLECRIFRRDRELRYVLVNIAVTKDAAGQTIELHGANQDITDRKQAEVALRSSEERFRIAAETANDVLYEWDLEEGLVWLGNIDEMLGYAPREFPRTLSGWMAAVHPEDQERVMAAVRGHLEGRAPFATEYRVRRKDGAYRVWSARGAAARAADGKPIRMIGSITDITERRQAEAALRESEAEFRALAEAMPQIVWITRPDGWNTYFNQQWVDYTGLTMEESNGHGWNTPFHPDDRQRAWDAWQRAVATAGTYSIESRLRRADGVYRWWLVRGVPQRDTTGQILNWFGTCTDIHDLKQAEVAVSRINVALTEAEAKYRSIFENSDEGIFQSTPDGRYVSANPALARILGFASPEELIREHSDLEREGKAEPALRENHRRLLEERGSLIAFEQQVRRKNGTVIWTSENTRIVRDASGRAIYYEGSVQDITMRKQSEAELATAHRKLLETSRQAGMAEIATSVLHNVGNVLNSVNVSATLVAERVRHTQAGNIAKVAALFKEHTGDLAGFLTKDSRGQQIPTYLGHLAESLATEQTFLITELEHLGKNVEHIKDIISMQQTYARTVGLTESVAVPDLIEDALRMSADALARNGVEVIRDYQTRPVITADRHKVVQILINLVRNAGLACVEGGRPQKRITVRTTSTEHAVQIAVIDNGVGIPVENLTRIFNHGFTTRKDGHGFGLHGGALAARELGGALSGQSDGPGRGAVFILELPLKPDSPAHENPVR